MVYELDPGAMGKRDSSKEADGICVSIERDSCLQDGSCYYHTKLSVFFDEVYATSSYSADFMVANNQGSFWFTFFRNE